MSKLPLADPDYAQIQAQLAQQRSYQVSANQNTANRLGEMAQKYPWMDGQVLTALVFGGADDATIGGAAQAAAKAKQATGAPAPGVSPPPHHGGGGNPFTDFAGDVAGAVGTAAKGVVRTATGVAQSAYQEVQNRAAQAVHTVGDIGSDIKGGDLSAALGDYGRALTLATPLSPAGVYAGTAGPAVQSLGATTAGQAALNVVNTGDPGLGSGWMTGKDINAQQAAAAREVRGTINGEAWTLGRQFADVGAGLGVIQPGSVQYKMVSGLVDTASIIVADPLQQLHLPKAATPLERLGGVEDAANAAKAAEKAANVGALVGGGAPDLAEAQALADKAVLTGSLGEAAAKAATKDPEWYATVRGSAGLISGPSRNTVYTPQSLKWLFGTEGKRVVQTLAEEDNAAKLTRVLGNAEAGVAVANAKDPEAVIRALGPFLSDGTLRQFPTAGYWTGNLDSVGGRVVQRLQDRFRWANTVPESTRLPYNDPDTAFRNFDNALANAGVLGAERDKLASAFVTAQVSGDKPGMYKAVTTASKAVRDNLIAHGVTSADAADITSIVRDADRMSTWLASDIGGGVPWEMLNAAGHGPYRVGQLLDSGLYLYDPSAVKQIRELTGRLSQVVTKGVTKAAGPELGSAAPEIARLPKVLVEGAQDAIWKPATIFRPAYATRIILESIAKMLQSGKFDNSFDYIAAATGHGYGSDLTGAAFNAAQRAQELEGLINAGVKEGLDATEMEALRVEYRATNEAMAQGLSGYDKALINRAGGQNLRGLAGSATADYTWKNGSWVRASRDVNPDQWHSGMLDELAAQHADPVYQRVAHGGTFDSDAGHVAGSGMDGVADWIMGPGAKQMKPIFDTMGFDVTNAQDVKAYVNLVAADVARHTGNDVDLLDVVAHGRLTRTVDGEPQDVAAFAGYTGQGRLNPTQNLRDKISEFIDADNAPSDVRYQQSLTKQAASGGSRAKNAAAASDRLSRWMFSKLHGVPEDALGRSPLYRRTYWDYAAQLADRLDPAHAEEMLANAEKAGLSKSAMQSVRQGVAAASGDATIDEIHQLASGYALDEVRRLYMSAATNNQFLDMARIALPFGQAWGVVMKSWARIIADNPVAVYKGTRAVTALRNAVALPFGLSPGDVDGDGHRDGFFHPDPTTGQEVFNFPLSGELARMVTGVNAPLMAPASGISMATEVMPGLGPVAQLPLSYFVPDTPTFDDVNNLLFPYGRPTGGLTETLMPHAGWLAKLSDGFSKNEQSPMFARLWQQTAQYLATTDKYRGRHDAEALRELSDEAKSKAGVLLMMRGVTQAMGPSSPATRFVVQAKTGDVLTAKLIDDFSKMQQEDYLTATSRFLDKYGPDVWAYMGAATKSTVPGQQPTDTYDVWARNHPDLLRQYPEIASYFAPEGGTFDMQSYQRQLDVGGRKLVSTDDLLAAANARLGGMQWRQIKAQADEALTAATRPDGTVAGTVTSAVNDWLRAKKQGLVDQYPGFNVDVAGLQSAANRKTQITELEQAVNDKRINSTDAGQGLTAYLDARQQAADAAKALKLSSFASAKKAKPIRDWLRHQAEVIITAHPEFGRLFDQVLDGEMVDDAGAQ